MVYKILILLYFFAVSCQGTTTNLYVSTTGNDATGDGSIGNPYASVTKAAEILATANQPDWQKNIFIRGGSYSNTAIKLTASVHNNTTLQSYPGESAILYGGQFITTWTDNGDGTWKASLGVFPDSVTNVNSSGNYWQPRTLLVNGSIAGWACYPSVGKIHYSSQTLSNIVYTNSINPTTNNELCLDLSWSDIQTTIDAVDTGTKTITITANPARGPNTADVSSYLWRNGPEGLSAENMFFWDKTNSSVVYRPISGIDPNTLNIVVPSTSRILWVSAGSYSTPITNVVVSNLTFAVTTAEGCSSLSGTVLSPDDGGLHESKAVCVDYGEDCIIDSCTFYCIGGSAIGSTGNNRRTIVRNCVIHDCGISGTVLNGSSTVVSNNLIYNCGSINQSGKGVFAGENSITINNTVSNINGSGIFEIAYGDGNIVRDNWVTKCVKRLRDIGAIYTYSSTNGQIVHNFVSDSTGTNSDNGGVWDCFVHGIYVDADSTNYLVSSNIVLNCMRPLHNNNSINSNRFVNNIFLTTTNSDSWLFLSNSNLSRYFQQNIWMAAGTPRVRSYNSSDQPVDINMTVLDWHSNIVWSTTGQNSGNPTNATTADPLFVKLPATTPQYLEDADFSFQILSPCPGLGIQPLSLLGIGYNGGLQHRLPDLKASTLRVGNMRMSQ